MMALQGQAYGIPVHHLLDGLTSETVVADIQVQGISLDSRTVSAGDMFLACKGQKTDGARYIADAVKAGATVVVVEEGLPVSKDATAVPVFTVSELGKRAGIIASRFYGHPSREMELTGITGTNGKTSISWWLADLYTQLGGRSAGLIGTLGAGTFPDLDPEVNTTPDAITLNRTLAGFLAAGSNTVFMEVSSHALDQGRTSGLDIQTGVFTNLSHDHLDYHGDLEHYRDSKISLFRNTAMQSAVINIDDETGAALAADLRGRMPVCGYRIVTEFTDEDDCCDELIQARITASSSTSTRIEIHSVLGECAVETWHIGRFNIYNLLAVIGVLSRHELPFIDIVRAIPALSQVPGRLEKFNTASGAAVYVDYAHTPDALQKALQSLRQICSGRLICVFGCGGDRDRAKRPDMGAIAEQHADVLIITDDNPRGEDAEKIVANITAGIGSADKYVIEHDRSLAIAMAIDGAGSNDIVLIAGKGHESYQEIGNVRYPFSDRQQVRNITGVVT